MKRKFLRFLKGKSKKLCTPAKVCALYNVRRHEILPGGKISVRFGGLWHTYAFDAVKREYVFVTSSEKLEPAQPTP